MYGIHHIVSAHTGRSFGEIKEEREKINPEIVSSNSLNIIRLILKYAHTDLIRGKILRYTVSSNTSCICPDGHNR